MKEYICRRRTCGRHFTGSKPGLCPKCKEEAKFQRGLKRHRKKYKTGKTVASAFDYAEKRYGKKKRKKKSRWAKLFGL